MGTVMLKINDKTQIGKRILSIVKSNPSKGVQVVPSQKTSDTNFEFKQKMQAIRNKLIERHNATADDKIK